MKTIVKIGLTIGALGGVAALVYRALGKSREQVRKEEEKEPAQRISPVDNLKIQAKVESEEKVIYNFPRQLFLDCLHSSKISDDAIRPELSDDRDNIVHVRQYRDRRVERNILSISFQIPDKVIHNSVDRTRGNIVIPDILRAVKGRFDLDAGKMLDNEYLIYELNQLLDEKVNVETHVHGYVKLVWDNNGEKETLISKVPKETYTEMGFNNVSDYVAHVQNLLDSENGDNEVRIDCLDRGKKFSAEIIDATVEIEVKIPIKTKQHLDGIDENTAVWFLEKIYTDFSVDHRNKTISYDYFRFYDPDDNTGIDIYCLDQDRKLCLMEA